MSVTSVLLSVNERIAGPGTKETLHPAAASK